MIDRAFTPIATITAKSRIGIIASAALDAIEHGWTHSFFVNTCRRLSLRIREEHEVARVRLLGIFVIAAVATILSAVWQIPSILRPSFLTGLWIFATGAGLVFLLIPSRVVHAWPTSRLRRIITMILAWRAGNVPCVLMLLMPCVAAGQSPALSAGTDVSATFVESLKLLVVEHGARIAFQEKTRREEADRFSRSTSIRSVASLCMLLKRSRTLAHSAQTRPPSQRANRPLVARPQTVIGLFNL